MKMEEFKFCTTCGTKNKSSLQRCRKCDKVLSNVSSAKASRPITQILTTSPTQNRGWRDMSILFLIVVVVVVVVIIILIARNASSSGQSIPSIPTPSVALGLPGGIGTIAWHNETLGVNDGSFPPLDIGRNVQEVKLKQQAAQQLKAGNSEAALSLWGEALGVESNDAEALIYQEDQHVFTLGKPYITLVAAVSFTAPFPDVQYETQLQGIYVAQHENNNSNSPVALRILIANSGSDINNVSLIAQQIVQVAHQDKTVVGVIGWQTSSHCQDALAVLAKAGLPIISPQASSDALSGSSRYFFRVVPPNIVEAQDAAKFAENMLHITHPVIFLDPKDLYSQDLAQDFIDQFTRDGHSGLSKELFVTDKTKDFSALIQDAERYKPDAFIFTSASSVDAGLFQDALPISGLFAHIPVIAGDGSYVAHAHAQGRWYFAEFAYHGEINTPIAQQFAQEYINDFNLHEQKPAGYYGYSLANDHAILSYDATQVVLAALQMVYVSGKVLTPQDLADALPRISGANTFQGVSGQISFGSNHDPIDKTVVILFVSPQGYIQLQSIQGCLTKDCSKSG